MSSMLPFAAAPAAGHAPVPITLIGGFLGAGKTTLLNSLLSQAQGRRLAVLVNDFGELNIDALLVKRIDGQRVELANGCICCTIRDDLVAGVRELISSDAPPDGILIETSGVSDPLNVLHTFARSALRRQVIIENVVALVDALNISDVRAHEYWPLFERQIQAAYMIVLNKLSIADASAISAARQLIAEIAPDTPVFESKDGNVPLPLILGNRNALSSFRPEPEYLETPHPFTSLSFRSEKPLNRERFLKALKSLDGIAFRGKGLVQFAHYPLATLFQKVGTRCSFTDGPPWGALAPRTELVLIGAPDRFDKLEIQQALHDCEIA